MRLVRWWCVVGLAAVLWSGGVSASPPTDPLAPPGTGLVPAEDSVPAEDDDGTEVSVPLQDPPLFDTPNVVSAPLIVVPAGCASPAPAVAVFVATLVATDSAWGRYEIEQIRVGSLEGRAVGRLIDVRYGDDTRFLDVGQRYIVGVGVDATSRLLVSRVREPAPLFGGDAVIGLDDSDVLCPRVEDPVKTLRADGTSVESGLLTPLMDAKASLVSAVLRPLGVGLMVLLALVAFKHLVFAIGRTVRDVGTDEPEPMRRERGPRNAV